MGRRGTKPKPTEMKRLAGNPGKRPLPSRDRQPESTDLKAPTGHLPRQGWLLWNRLAPHLSEMGLFSELDRQALEMLCLHYAYAYKAEKGLRSQGLMATGSMGQLVKHPLHQVFMDHSKAFLRYATEFGMTPSSLASLLPAGGEEREKSLAELLFESVENER
jgi:P27 family predicted phage terminase small subunit